MSMENILNVAASAMSAESMRLNITASNIANAGTVGTSEEETFRAKHPVFSEITEKVNGIVNSEQPMGGVHVVDIIEDDKPLNWKMDPDNPMADKDGKVYMTDVNPIDEMADMISASKQYQASVEMMNTTKSLMMQTIKAINSI